MRPESFLDWLGALDTSPATDDEYHGPADQSPTGYETLLWRVTHALVNGTPEAPGPLRSFASHVQYMSMPLYSHVKASRDKTHPWLDCFPLFVGGTTKEEKVDRLGRYLLLYRALTERLVPFSLTGFAGSDEVGLRTVPRCLVVETRCGVSSLEVEVPWRGEQRGALLISASIEEPVPEIHLPASSELPNDFVTPHSSGQGFTPQRDTEDPNRSDVRAWWSAWERDALACEISTQLATIQTFALKVADDLSGAVAKGLEGRLKTKEPKTFSETVNAFSSFIAWNHALGFRRIAYLPFVSSRPGSVNWETLSWGGLILVMEQGTDLRKVLQEIGPKGVSPPLPSTGRKSLSPNAGAAKRSAADAVRMGRAFVDLCVPRMVFSDWAQFTRETEGAAVFAEMAGLISHGLKNSILEYWGLTGNPNRMRAFLRDAFHRTRWLTRLEPRFRIADLKGRTPEDLSSRLANQVLTRVLLEVAKYVGRESAHEGYWTGKRLAEILTDNQIREIDAQYDAYKNSTANIPQLNVKALGPILALAVDERESIVSFDGPGEDDSRTKLYYPEELLMILLSELVQNAFVHGDGRLSSRFSVTRLNLGFDHHDLPRMHTTRSDEVYVPTHALRIETSSPITATGQTWEFGEARDQVRHHGGWGLKSLMVFADQVSYPYLAPLGVNRAETFSCGRDAEQFIVKMVFPLFGRVDIDLTTESTVTSQVQEKLKQLLDQGVTIS